MLARKELDQVSLNLLAAADLLDKGTWIKGNRYNKEGGACLIGYIELAKGKKYLPDNIPEKLRMAQYLRPKYNFSKNTDGIYWTIANWNDSVCKTKEEAVAKLREAAYAAVKAE